MKTRKLLSILLAAVFCFGLASAAAEDVTIALIAPQTGDNAQYGNAYVTGDRKSVV